MKTIEEIIEERAKAQVGGVLTSDQKKILREMYERGDRENHKDFSPADYGEPPKGAVWN